MRTDYEQLASRYDEDRSKWSCPRDDVVDALLASRSPVRVLDVGCGTGRWVVAQREWFADANVEWLGCDPSPAMLAEASAKGTGSLVCARAEDLPVRDGTLDYVVSSYTFHHFTDKEQALDEADRVMTPRGVFRINNIDPDAAAGWWVYEFFPEVIAVDAARFWPAERIAESLRARGFDVEVVLDRETCEIPAVDALADAERRVVSQLAVLDDASYERGLARLREAAAPPDAALTTVDARLYVTARRTP